MSDEWITYYQCDVRYIDDKGRTYFIERFDKRSEADVECIKLNDEKKECYKDSDFEHREICDDESKRKWTDGEERYQVFMKKARKSKNPNPFSHWGSPGYGGRFSINVFYY